jgi:hypothetical protein
MLRQRSSSISPSANTSSGQTNHGNANTQSNTSHGSSAGASHGNQRTASRTPSNQKSFGSNRARSTSHQASRNRGGGGGHARTTYRPARVASHSFGGNRGGGGHHRSDIRLKEDIVALTRLDNGIGIYRFRYKGNDHTAYVGVMAQEVAKVVPDAVTRGRDGYLRVDYDHLGLEFMTWDEWMARRDAKSGLVQ